jgi:hypothetical protein
VPHLYRSLKKMKLHTTASVLTIVLWVFWLVPLQGKKLAPDIFGTSPVQWTCAVIVAICIPIAVLMALKLLSQRAQRRVGFGIAFFACLPLLCSLVMYGIMGTMLARTNIMLQRGHERDSEVISTLTHRALSEDTAESRAKSAGLLYGMFGVQPVWKNAEEEFERYYPTVEQQEMWEQTVDTTQIEVQTTEMIDWQLKQMPWLFGLYLGSFTLIILTGLAWKAYKPSSEQDGAHQPATAPGSKSGSHFEPSI